MFGGPKFAGIYNLFRLNSGLECRKSALLRAMITKFPGGAHVPGPLVAEYSFGARMIMSEKIHFLTNPTPLLTQKAG